MPIFLAALLGGLVSALGSIVGRVLISLGIGYTAYSGFNVLLDFIKTRIFLELAGLDPVVIGIVSVLQIDTAINILSSAVAVRLVIQGVTALAGGTVVKAGVKA